jgi:para-aminobenzoate synthetase/4-amino-4-deoxychorismate lyase
MKGTVRRGRTTAEDRFQQRALQTSAKQQAENVMIVDMVRNDLGRIAEVGSVEVPEMFSVERYPNVWQMTSLVTGRSQARLPEVFQAMHPSASVTGAPKVRTMDIIRTLEDRPRGVYTGAVGHVAPGGSAHFNVAIRTAFVDDAGTVEFGVGSGIVWDSNAADEYDECLAKGAILGNRVRPFELLETFRWTSDGGFLLLDRHLQRLRDSAGYFGFEYSEPRIRAALNRAVANSSEPLRVRLLLSRTGETRVEQTPLLAPDVPVRVQLAEDSVDSSDVFLFHKSTNRHVYNRRLRPGCDDTILWNQIGQVTEATKANVVVDLHGSLVTPPVECGLLAGTFRAELLSRGELQEAIVTTAELRQANRLWLINSVHEWRPAVLWAPERT